MNELETRVSNLLEANPDKDFTIVEIVFEVYQLKPSINFHLEHYDKIWNVIGALNSLFAKGKVDWLSGSRHALLCKLKKK